MASKTMEVTTRGDLANRAGDLRTAVLLFIDPSDAPFLEDWLRDSQDGHWGCFRCVEMADASLPFPAWGRALQPRWWLPLDSASKHLLATGPTSEKARQVVGVFPEISRFDHAIFACTYGKSRSALTAQAYRRWTGHPSEDAALVQRNPWWHHLLERALADAGA